MSDREAERSDLYAVKDAAERKCTCDVAAKAIRSELTFKEFKRLLCKACRAAACLTWLVELSEEA